MGGWAYRPLGDEERGALPGFERRAVVDVDLARPVADRRTPGCPHVERQQRAGLYDDAVTGSTDGGQLTSGAAGSPVQGAVASVQGVADGVLAAQSGTDRREPVGSQGAGHVAAGMSAEPVGDGDDEGVPSGRPGSAGSRSRWRTVSTVRRRGCPRRGAARMVSASTATYDMERHRLPAPAPQEAGPRTC